MKIIWNQNPMRTVVELNDEDRLAMCASAKADGGELDANALETELRNSHCGDCIGVPCACLKCWAEGYAGIDTLPGLTKHLAHKVNAAFGESGDRSLAGAIEALTNYAPKPWSQNREIWDVHLPRWHEEAKAALAWLIAYRDRHFPGFPGHRAVEETREEGTEEKHEMP